MGKDTLVVNLYGGPGSGKSTSAAGLFYLLKRQGVEAEIVTEYAKDLVWEDSAHKLEYQIYVFAKQLHRVHRLLGKVDVVVSDSPTLLSLVYGSDQTSPEFKALVKSEHNKMNTFNVFTTRVKPYNPNGRNETEEEAKIVDEKIRAVLPAFDLEAPGDDRLPHLVFAKIMERLNG